MVFVINFSQHILLKKKDITSCLESVEISQPFLSRILDKNVEKINERGKFYLKLYPFSPLAMLVKL